MKKKVNSFDVFDTLIARNIKHPTNIFDIIEEKYPFKNFKNIRIDAEIQTNKTFDDIYVKFKNITKLKDDEIDNIKKYELDIEYQYSIPIMTNINKIKEGDIYISDMYLSEEHIKKLLSKHNINTNNKLYVSSGGKHSGYKYEKLSKDYDIVLHTGDNVHSDINMSKKYGINSYLSKYHIYNDFELALNNHNIMMANIYREMRLMNPYNDDSIEYKLYNEQVIYNIPTLFYICNILKKIMDSEKRSTLLFLTRDSCLLIKLFKYLFPDINCIYFSSSRIINNNYNEYYINYVKKTYNHDTCLLFDMCGSFNSGRKLYINIFGYLPRVHILIYMNKAPIYNGLTYSYQILSDRTETSNNDYIGTLLSYDEEGEIRAPVEINKRYIDIQHNVLNYLLTKYDDSQIKLLYDSVDKYSEIYKKQFLKFIDSTKTIISNNSSIRLCELANKYKSDKGNTYKCAHNYVIHYEKLIDYYANKLNKHIHFLEIGLNRDGTDSIPSISMWNEYFHYNNINLYEFDIKPQYKKFTKNNIKIYIGDQSNTGDLQQLKENIYTIIVDDGYHASQHQQITFRELWDTVEKGGCYVIEDLHWQPYKEDCILTKDLLLEWQKGNYISSKYINDDFINIFKNTFDKICFYDSDSKIHDKNLVKNALVFIYKK